MSRATVLARGRAFAAGGFVDACTIQRPEGDPQTSPIDGTTSQSLRTLYSGPCRFQQAAAPWAGPATVGQAGIGLSAEELQLPVAGTAGIDKDDIVTCTAATNDPDLLGKQFSVQGTHHATHKTTRRLPIQEIIG
jgi:hypothetical protein